MSVHQSRNLAFGTFLLILLSFSACKKGAGSGISLKYDNQKVEQCQSTYEAARKYQKNENYNRAIAMFEACLRYDSPDKRTADSLYFCISNAMLQLMNTYQACGKVEDCVKRFEKMAANPSTMIRKYCLRDLYSIYAYALYRYDKMPEAEATMQKALNMHYTLSTHENLFRDYSYAAAIYYCIPNKQDQLTHYALLGLKESEYCEHTSGAQWLLSVLADTYSTQGEIKKAIDLHYQAIKVAHQKNDTIGASHAYMGLANIYLEWNMNTYANNCMSMAAQNIKDQQRYPDILASIYINKANCLYALNRKDSMDYYLRKAESFCKDLPYTNGQATIDYLRGIAMAESNNRNSIFKGIALLDSVTCKSYKNMKSKAFYGIAKAYIKVGDNRKGEAMLDSMYNILHKSSEPNFIVGANLYALQYYIAHKNTPNIIRYSEELAKENQFNQDRQVDRKLGELYMQINTEKQIQQLEYYKMETKNAHLRLIILIFVSLTIVTLILIFFFHRRKMYRMQNLLMNERLDKLSQEMLVEIENHKETKMALSKILDSDSHRNITNLSANMLKENGAIDFKKHFEILYPGFLDRLKDYSNNSLGNREELVCMLIALGQSNNQIADILYIAYRSVIVSRYRIKQKMKISTEESLDDIIKDLLK